MSERYERIGEGREPEFPDDPTRAPEFGGDNGAANGDQGVLRGRTALSQATFGRAAAGATAARTEQPGDEDDRGNSLLGQREVESFKGRWPEIKAAFVDDPHDSVRLADDLLTEVAELITRRVNEERTRLEVEWQDRNDVTTEDLRQSLHRYQLFFERLAKA